MPPVSLRALRSSRVRRTALAIALLAATLGCGRSVASGARGPAADRGRPYVILVSFDAFRHDYLDRYHPSAFEAIAARGVRATSLVPAFPSMTFPNHYSLATGLYPGHHGIVENIFYDPARDAWYRSKDTTKARDGRWYGGEPIWATAERNGVRSATYFWPGSEAEIGGVRPTYVKQFTKAVTKEQQVDGAISWLRLPPAERPHLLLIYFSEVDETTHAYGTDAPQTASAVASVNRALQRLADSVSALPIRDSVNFVLVSDHGMMEVPPKNVMAVGEILAQGGIDTSGVLTSESGPTLSLWFKGDSSAMRRSYDLLAKSLPHARVYWRPDTPERWHVRDNVRAGDLLVIAEGGYVLKRRSDEPGPKPGQHGFDPALPEMHGIFIAAGPGVKPAGTIPSFENVNVYPFVARLLRLDHVPRVDGDARMLAPLLR
jgi:predicted AlkP superfamily pyrophosphatase or phosphodiesterase